MFDFSWSELLLIGVVALIFIGPKELPGVLRTLGQWMTKIRRMAGDFQNQFHDAMREAELADLKKEVDTMAAQAAGYSHFDPLADVRKDLENTQREIESAVAGTPAESPGAKDPSAEPAGSVPPSAGPETGLVAQVEPRIAESVGSPDEGPPAGATDASEHPVKQTAAGSEPA
jgi:sec-independent protein translocase protein TatB